MTAVDFPELHLTEVDGVPTVWAAVQGPLRGGLTFRVGSADETLVTAGATHLVEHLALFGLGQPGEHSNGQVDHTTTLFHCVGDNESVVEFLGAVARQLTDLPLSRLEDERNVLRAEAAGKRSSLEALLLTWRYGAAGYGLTNQAQLGVEHLDGAALAEWSRTYLTRGNAALCLSGPPPAGLRLPLPDGGPMPAPDPRRSVLPRFPAWFEGPQEQVSMSAVLERGYGTAALADLLRRRLVDELRTRLAISYSPDAMYRRLTGDAGLVVVTSDVIAGRESDALPVLASLLGQLATPDGVSDQDLAALVRARRQQEGEAYAPLGALFGSAFEMVMGRPVLQMAEYRAGVERVSVEDVSRAAAAALANALVCLPANVVSASDDGAVLAEPWTRAPLSTEQPIEGRTYLPAPSGAAGETLVVTERGLTLRNDAGDHLTVPVASTVAVQHWPDGRRALTAVDANRVVVEPNLWQDGDEAVAEVDRIWPAALRVGMPERPADSIPRRTSGVSGQAGAEHPSAKLRWGARNGMVLFGVIALLCAGLAIASELPALLVVAAFFGFSAYRCYRQYRELDRRIRDQGDTKDAVRQG